MNKRLVMSIIFSLFYCLGVTASTNMENTGNVKKFGAKGDGEHDDTRAIQKAMDAYKNNEIDEVFFPSGIFKITSQLEYHTKGYSRGIRMIGSGESSKIILDNSKIAQSIISIDGASLKPYQFQRGGYISDLSLTSKHKKIKHNGITITGWLLYKIEGLIIKSLGGNGIIFPLREEIDKNPDAYASAMGEINRTEISFNNGWGILAESGIGFGGAKINMNRIGENKGGGIMMGGHNNVIENCSIFSNGNSQKQATGGILIQRVQGNANNCVIRYCELDNNKAYHIKIDGGAEVVIENNRMNSWETVFNDGELSPSTHILMVTETPRAKVVGVYCNRNYHRSQNRQKGASKEHNLTLYDFSNSANVSEIEVENVHIPKEDNTSNIHLYENKNINSRIAVKGNKGEKESIKMDVPASSVRITKTKQHFTKKNKKIIFDNIYFEYEKIFNIKESSYKIPTTGFYMIDVGLTVQSEGSEWVEVFISTPDGILKRIKQNINKSGEESIAFNSMIYLKEGTRLFLKLRSSASSYLVPDSTKHWMGIHLIK